MKKKFIIPYQYIIIGTAQVEAETLEQATEFIESSAVCHEPESLANEIFKVRFSCLSDSFEIHHEDLDIVNQ